VSTITFVQVNSATPQSASTTVTVPFTKAQTAGNLNVVVVGWNDSTSQVQSVVDSKGNVYSPAVGPTVSSGFATQSIFYAKNIVAATANANSVTVTFNTGAAFPDIRILEYSGIDTTTPLDVTSASTGSSTLSATGPIATKNATDMLFAANMVATATTGAGAGFTNRVITTPDGDIAEDQIVSATGSYTATATVGPAGAWIMQMVAFRAAGSAPPPPPDTTPPTVSVTSPNAGATVRNNVTLTASASDSGSGVAGVQFQIDGIGVGGPLTASPYSMSFDSTQFANASHVITAYAWDNSGNIGNATPVTVTFSNSNPGNPAVTGYFNTPTNWPVVTVHINLMPNGKVLAWDGQDLGTIGTVWDPVIGTFVTIPSPNNLFCSSHAGLPDGRVMAAGGHISTHVGLPTSQIFDPSTNSWTTMANMANGRWYPTLTALPDGRMLVLSGETNCDGCDVTVPEIFNPSANTWTALSTATHLFPYYPHPYVLPDGRVLVAGTSEEPIVSQILDITNKTWTAIGGPAVDGGSSVMYLPGKFLKTGTSTDPDLSVRSSAATAYTLDTTQPSPTWKAITSMAFPRTYHTLTVLPDGKVLVTGGGTTTDATLPTQAVLQAEMWNPSTQTFTTIGSLHNPRLYHSNALLLPDARVLISGGGRFNGTTDPTDQQNGEIFAPPYLFKGARPTIASVPSTWQYGQNVTVQTPDAATIASVSLIRIGNVTHTINMSQRYLPLTFAVGSSALTVTAPANANLAPPGVYMLFLVNSNGVPSVASMINFGTPAPDTQPPTQPTNLIATGGLGSVSLTWNTSTDNVGVTGYHVYRSTTSGFTPSPSNLIANASTNNYTDSGLFAGTYFYLVAAFDAAGNTSTPSNEASGTATADTTPPTAPTNLTATVVSSGQINLAWTASTDNVGVAGYRVERCQGASCTTFAQIATPTTTSFSDTGLSPATSYSYRVRATDAAGNLSTYSNTASATTQAGPPPTGTIAFVQVNSATPQSSPTSVNATFNAAQTAGDLNVVAVGWNDATHQVSSVTDTKGNVYALAVGPTVNSAGGLSQSIYYAKNILGATAGGNTVTVTFNGAAAFPDIRILEYNGADLVTPVDVTAVGTGSSTTSSTAAVTTTNANDLLFAANLVATGTTGPGAGFTSRVITVIDSDIAEDRLVTAAGSYSASAPMVSAGAWVMQMVAFRVAGGTPPPPDTTPPTAPTNLTATAASSTQINLSWTASTDNVGVTGYLLERCQGAACSTFAQIATPTATSFNDTGLTASTTYSYRVRATDAANNLSSYSNIASATTPAPPDTTPPTAPSNLTATAAGSTQINLSWTASTDNVGVTGYLVERCQGAACSTFAQIATPTATSFNDTGLTASTTYSYRVRATDAANNLSSYSNTASASTPAPPDTTPPTAPSNLTATAAGSTQINLSWTASTDNVGVTGYLLERCQGAGCTTFAQIATPAATSFSDTGLTASTSYSYRVRATDAANNLSTYSNTASATTQAGPDTTPPTAPTNLAATAASSTQINLSWTASTDNVGVTGYLLERCQGAACTTFAQIATPTATSFSDTGLTASTSYSYRVRATDAASNLSTYSNTASATTPAPPDTTPPTAPTNLTATAASSTQISLSWTASTDNVGVTGYLVERCQGASCTTFAQIATPTATSFNNTGLTASTSYSYRVRATDAANNLSSYSNTASATTPAPPDTTPPTAPTNLTATAASSTQINLSWTASTDNVGVTGYLVERCQGAGCTTFAQIATPTATSFSDTGLTASTSYSYRVRATDAANNLSSYSNTASATTPAPPDTTPPTAPSNLTASVISSGQINLAWTASTDNVGVTGYRVERCQGAGCTTFAQIAAPTTTSFSDTGLSPSTSYSYRVRAADAAGNLSSYSNTASGTTQAGPPPTGTITFVQVNAATPQSSPTSVNVTFNAAQTAGDLNVVAVGWNDATHQVSSVTDTKGNVYTLAVGPTVFSGLSQSIYYAKNIAAATAGSNTVTVTFNGATAFPDIRIVEYNGADLVTPVDVTATGTGSSATSSTAAVTTTNANDLLFGANLVATGTTGPGAGFTNRIITTTDSDIAEDRLVTATGSYSASAPMVSSGAWLMQMVAFRVAGGAPPPPDTTPPTAPASLTSTAGSSTQINLAWTASTDNVGVTGYLVERCQGAGCTTFAQIATPTTTSFSDTGLTASTSYSYRVRATDAAGNLSSYSNTASATTTAGGTTPNLVAAYSFNEGSGTTVNDSTGNGNTGTIVNATWTTAGKFGNALSFNGTNARVAINDSASLHLTSGVTLEAWVNPSVAPTGWQDVIYKPNDNYFLTAGSAPSNLPNSGVSLTNNTEPLAPGAIRLAANTWVHLAMTYDGANLKMYVNGALVNTVAQSGTIVTSTNQLQIGGDTLFSQYFQGLIDEVRVYNIALTQAQIQSDMNTALP
jgi:chitodextrinase